MLTNLYIKKKKISKSNTSWKKNKYGMSKYVVKEIKEN